MKLEQHLKIMNDNFPVILAMFAMFLCFMVVTTEILTAVDWPWEEEEAQSEPDGSLPPAPRPDCIKMPDNSFVCNK